MTSVRDMASPGRNLVKSIQATVKPLTPVHVWSGENLIMDLDMVIVGRDVCVIDLSSLDDETIEKIAKAELDELGDMLRRGIKEGWVRCRYRVSNRLQRNLMPGTQVKEISRQFIPGSELKGYIRTAVAYESMNKNIHELENRLNRVNIYEGPNVWATPIETFYRVQRPGKVGGFVDSFQSLLISDPTSINPELAIVDFEVYELGKGSLGQHIARQPVIALVSGELRYVINLLMYPENIYIDRAPKELGKAINKLRDLDLDLVRRALSYFGCKLLKYEVDRISNIQQLRGYLDMLRKWLSYYCENDENDCVAARLGFMTGHHAKTIMILIKERFPDRYQQLTSNLSSKLGRLWDEKTLKLVKIDEDFVGVGWCEICLKD